MTDAKCTGKANQKWLAKAAGMGYDGLRKAYTVTQETTAGRALCVDVDAK